MAVAVKVVQMSSSVLVTIKHLIGPTEILIVVTLLDSLPSSGSRGQNKFHIPCELRILFTFYI